MSHDRCHMSHCQYRTALANIQLKRFFSTKLNELTVTKNCVKDKSLIEEFFFFSSMAKSRFVCSSLTCTPCSFFLEIRSKTDAAPPAKILFGTLGQIQRMKHW